MIEYTVEDLDTLHEMMPLIAAHHNEVDIYKDKVHVVPMLDTYQKLEDSGCLAIYVMRDEGKLVGYNMFVLSPHPHYGDTWYGTNDILYIDPEYRKQECVPTFIKRSEAWLKEEGVEVITYSLKEGMGGHKLLEFLEYDKAEVVFSKYVGK